MSLAVRSLALLVLAVALLALSGGSASAEPALAEGTVGVILADDFTVTPSVNSIAEGTVTFDVSNDGVLPHNFRVIRSDLAIDALPTAVGSVDEGAVDVRGSTADLGGGGTEAVEVDLEAGSYVLICNVPGHYLGGMRVAFTVETPSATETPAPASTPAPTIAPPADGLPIAPGGGSGTSTSAIAVAAAAAAALAAGLGGAGWHALRRR